MAFATEKVVFLLVWSIYFSAGVKGIEKGKIDMQQVGVNDFHCQYVPFSASLSGIPLLFVSLNHGDDSLNVHDTAFIWVEDVTTSGFSACVVQGGKVSGDHRVIDWFAFEGPRRGVFHGQSIFSRFTTGTKCNLVVFPQAFAAAPNVQVTVNHRTLNQRKDAMSVWIENLSRSQFEVCLRESRTFDGPHESISVSWMAHESLPPEFGAKESSQVEFSENEIPTAKENYAICKQINFTIPYYEPPVVLAAVRNGPTNIGNARCPIKEPLNGWLEEITRSQFRVCIKDDAGYNGQRSTVIVDYLVVGDLDPCSNASCKYHSKCEASSPQRFTCVCENSCPSYEEQVCASNGQTFRNLCLLRLQICRTRGNYTALHSGSCTVTQVHGKSSCHSSRVWQLPDGTEIIESNQIGTLYSDNSDCHWVLSSNAKIELAFLRFELKSGDYVYVHDGGTETSPLIGQFSGSYLPSPVTSSSNTLFVRFTSDYSVTSLGFRARYRVLTEGAVRIVGSDLTTGRVEVFQNDQWGTICDNGWDTNDGRVVCRQLGFDRVSQVFSGASHGQGTGPIWIDQLACSGIEASIDNCRYGGNLASCTHGQDASVACSYRSPVIRLVNGCFNNGRVEVFDSGIWGTICDDTWDINDANVACRQLGFTGASSANVSASFGQGSGPIWRDHIKCRGSESSLLDCPFSQHGIDHCVHGEDAGVVRF